MTAAGSPPLNVIVAGEPSTVPFILTVSVTLTPPAVLAGKTETDATWSGATVTVVVLLTPP